MTTNNILKTLLFPVLISLTFVSCADFLNEMDPNRITVDSFWKTEADFQKGLMATYSALTQGNVMGSGAVNSGHVQGEIGRPDPWGTDREELMTFVLKNTNGIFSGKWQSLYTGIFSANQVLDQLKNSNLDNAIKTGIEAETRFLRGLYYFWLANCFNQGSVCLHTSVPKVDADYYKPLSPKADILALIIDDLNFAQANLPRSWNNANLGRATWGAATGILGQLYLYEKRYDDAKREFKAIIDSDIYRLTTDINWNFDVAHEHNSESIFEVNFSETVKPGESATNAHFTGRAVGIAPQEARGSRNLEPSYYFIMLCKSDPIDPANPVNAGQKFSQRCLATICFKGDEQIFYQRPSYNFPFMVFQEGHIKKFQNWWLPQEPTTNRSGINERVMRLADVYLMYAETVLMTTGDVNEAIRYINMVRERSAVLKLEAGEYDRNTLMTHLMRVERPLELAYEGHMIRWMDLRRWGIAKQVFDEMTQMVFIRNSNTNVELQYAPSGYVPESEEQLVIQYEATAKNYNTELDYWPIPNAEILLNPHIQ